MEAEPEVLAASVESTSEKKVWPELALRWGERASLPPALGTPWDPPVGPERRPLPPAQRTPAFPPRRFPPPCLQGLLLGLSISYAVASRA